MPLVSIVIVGAGWLLGLAQAERGARPRSAGDRTATGHSCRSDAIDDGGAPSETRRRTDAPERPTVSRVPAYDAGVGVARTLRPSRRHCSCGCLQPHLRRLSHGAGLAYTGALGSCTLLHKPVSLLAWPGALLSRARYRAVRPCPCPCPCWQEAFDTLEPHLPRDCASTVSNAEASTPDSPFVLPMAALRIRAPMRRSGSGRGGGGSGWAAAQLGVLVSFLRGRSAALSSRGVAVFARPQHTVAPPLTPPEREWLDHQLFHRDKWLVGGERVRAPCRCRACCSSGSGDRRRG